MHTEAELLAAIDANPDDDAPRLAHADWLQANGDQARAELISRRVVSGVAGRLPLSAPLDSIND